MENRHELFNDPWGGLSEIDFERITTYGTYSQVEVKRMYLKCVGERAPESRGYPTANDVRTADEGKYELLNYSAHSYV